MKECTLIIPRRKNRYGLALKHKIHADGKVLAGSEEKWNGWGGKREEEDRSMLHTCTREWKQETGSVCFPWNLKLSAIINFHWPGDRKGEPTMRCHVYFLDFWLGRIHASEEAGEPGFFLAHEVPYDKMMKGDKVFLPRLIAGERFEANMYFDDLDEKGLPKLEVIRYLASIPWYRAFQLYVLTAWKKAF